MFAKLFAVGSLVVPALVGASDPAGLPVPPADFDKVNSAIPHGTVSAVLKYPTTQYGQRDVVVYTPPGYSATSGIKYPVLYLHHGVGGSAPVWTSGAEGDADNVMDYLYSKNLAKPMIIVMPTGKVDGGDSFAQFGNFEGVEIKDLIPWVEKTYPVIPTADARAIAGLSMGGGQTFNMGFPNTDVYHYIGPFSAAPNTKKPAETIKDPAKVKSGAKYIFIACGGSDGLISNSKMYHDFLDQNNITHVYQVEPSQGHTKTVWNRSLYNYAQKIFADVTVGIDDRIRPIARGTQARILFGQAARGSASIILAARPDGEGVFGLDGRQLPAPGASPFQGIRIP